jgi:hypothetical protein
LAWNNVFIFGRKEVVRTQKDQTDLLSTDSP